MGKAYPSSSVVVFDLPAVVEAAQKHFPQEGGAVAFESGEDQPSHFRTGSVLDPCVLTKLTLSHPGDFFKDEIPPADLYVLARIVHDWPEETCLTLLRRIHDASKSGEFITEPSSSFPARLGSKPLLPPGGGVLLVEAMLFENRRGPVAAQLFSLNMLVQAEGRERSPSEYTHMLNRTGFRDVQVCRTGKSYDAILAIR